MEILPVEGVFTFMITRPGWGLSSLGMSQVVITSPT